MGNCEALVKAAKNGHADVCRLLLSEGPTETRAWADARDSLALVQAAKWGHAEVCSLLNRYGVSCLE